MNNLALKIGPPDDPNKYSINGPTQLPTGGLEKIVLVFANGIAMLLIAVIIASLFMIIFSGIQWTTSGGDEKNLEKAKGRLKYSIIGLAVSLSSFFIILFIASFFGLASILTISF